MSKISAIIFSRDRACQLSLLLESLERNASNLFESITVIWTCSNSNFARGYEKLKNRYPSVNFDFEGDTSKLLDSSWSQVHSWEDEKFRDVFLQNLEVSYELICPMVDDNIFWKKVSVTTQNIATTISDCSVFCLRMGRNIRISDQFTNQELWIPPIHESENFISWLRVNGHTPWGYPISLDGNVFSKDWMVARCNQIDFSNPNFLEGNLQKFNSDFEIMVSEHTSSLVGVPCNRVQNTFENRTTNQYTPEELNQKWLNGNEIDFDSLDFSNINSTHCNLEYIFKVAND